MIQLAPESQPIHISYPKIGIELNQLLQNQLPFVLVCVCVCVLYLRINSILIASVSSRIYSRVFHYLQFLSETGNTLKGTHTTPIKLYVDDIMYTFTDAGDMCNVEVSPFQVDPPAADGSFHSVDNPTRPAGILIAISNPKKKSASGRPPPLSDGLFKALLSYSLLNVNHYCRVIPPRSCGTPFWTTAPTTATFTIWLKAPISTRRRPTRRPPATASAPSTLPGTAKFISPAPFPIRIWIFRYFFSISHHLTFAYLFPFSFFPPPPRPSVSQSVTQPVLCFLFFVAIRKKEKKKEE